MKYINTVLLSLASIVITSGCKHKNIQCTEFNIQESVENISTLTSNGNDIKHITLRPENIYGFFTNIAVVDSFLICGNLRSSKLISVYSLKADTLVNEAINRGTAVHEGLSVGNIFIQNNNLAYTWVYDITLGKLFKLNILKALEDTSYTIEKENNLVGVLKNMVTPQIVNDSILMATTYSLDDNRYIYATSQAIQKKIGKLPEISNAEQLTDPPNTKFPNRAFIFKAMAVRNPSKNMVAVFYNKTDRAEFYKNDSLIKIIVGQKKFGPIMQVKKLDTGFSVEDCEKTRFSYLSITSSNDLIYCLTAGNIVGETCSNKILVFNWEGDLVNEVILNRAVCKIYIDSPNNILYCYDNIDNGIFSADLNLKK